MILKEALVRRYKGLDPNEDVMKLSFEEISDNRAIFKCISHFGSEPVKAKIENEKNIWKIREMFKAEKNDLKKRNFITEEDSARVLIKMCKMIYFSEKKLLKVISNGTIQRRD
jgi:hypothetical protein